MSKPIVVLGAGGHASVLMEILFQQNRNIIGVIAKDRPASSALFDSIPFFSDDEDVLLFDKEDVLLVNGVGSLPGSNRRSQLHQKFKQLGYDFMTVVSPAAIVSDYCKLAEGVQVMPGAILNANCVIGESTIVNTGAIIEHDCKIGNHNHVAPGATLSGAVSTGDFVHIGTGASIIQSITIGSHVLVSAGSTVLVNLSDNSKHYVAKPYIS